MNIEPGPDPLLRVRGISKRYGGIDAVKDFDLDMASRGVHALIGPNGAGKTTCFGLISRFIRSDSGSIEFSGRDITHLPPDAVARRGMIRSFQISAVFPALTVMENVAVGLQRQKMRPLRFWNPAQRFGSLSNPVLKLLDQFGLAALADSRAGDLPYGQRRLLELASTIALEPKLVLLDEPMAGLGREDIDQVARRIAQIAEQRAVLMVEHNTRVVARIAGQVTVMHRGEVLARGSYPEISADRNVIDAYLGAMIGE